MRTEERVRNLNQVINDLFIDYRKKRKILSRLGDEKKVDELDMFFYRAKAELIARINALEIEG